MRGLTSGWLRAEAHIAELDGYHVTAESGGRNLYLAGRRLVGCNLTPKGARSEPGSSPEMAPAARLILSSLRLPAVQNTATLPILGLL